MKTKVELLDDALAVLAEHFDHIQILTTWNENSLTKSLFRGAGNWHARQGAAHEFISLDIAQQSAKEIAEQLNPPDNYTT
jgi:hypothetical protein